MEPGFEAIIKAAISEAAPEAIKAIGNAFKDKVKADLRVRHGNDKIDEKTLDTQKEAFLAQYGALLHAAAPFSKIEHHYLYRSKGFGDMTTNLARRLADLKVEETGFTDEHPKYVQLFTNALHQMLMTYQTTDPQHPMDYWAERMEKFVRPEDIDKLIAPGKTYDAYTKPYLNLMAQGPGFFELTMRLDNFEGEARHAPFEDDMGKKGKHLRDELRWTGELTPEGRVKFTGHGFGIGTETINAVKQAAKVHATRIAKEYR
jgi:hypothetical protein